MRSSKINSRCQKQNHENNEFIKVCMNQRCTERRLCQICCDQLTHENHQEFDDSQIINITQLIKECEQKNIVQKQLHDRQENQISQIRQQIQNIYKQLTNLINQLINLNRDVEIEIKQNSKIIDYLNKRQYKTEHINKIVSSTLIEESKLFEQCVQKFQLINQFTVSQIDEVKVQVQSQNYTNDTQQNQVDLIDLQNKVSFQDFIGNKLPDNQSPDKQTKDLKNYETQLIKLEERLISQIIEKDQPSNLHTVCYKYDSTINQAQISPCGKYFACSTDYKVIVTVIKSKFQREINSSILIQSLKFSSDSFILYFSDESGFIYGIELSTMKVQYCLRLHKYSIEQIFLINDLKFLTLCQKEQQIKITKLDSLGYSSSEDTSQEDAFYVPDTDLWGDLNQDEYNSYFQNHNQESLIEDGNQEDDQDYGQYDKISDQQDFQQDCQDNYQENQDSQDPQKEQESYDYQDDDQSSEKDDQSENQYWRDQTIEKQIQQKIIYVDHIGYLQIDYNQENDLLAYPHYNCLYICQQDINLEQYRYIIKQIQEYNIFQSFVVKFLDREQLLTAQRNLLHLYQYDLNQEALSILRKFNLNSEIYSIVISNQSVVCDMGEKIVIIKDYQQNSCLGVLADYPKQLRHYSPYQNNSKNILVIRGSVVILINIDQ